MSRQSTQVQLCGELRVTIRGERRESALRGRQGRLLFAHLVLHRHRPVRRDELVEALWSDGAAPPSEGALAPLLSRLRSAIAPGTVEGREQLTLVLPEPVEVDVELARDALDRAREAMRAGAAADAAGAAGEAARLVEAGLLPGFDAAWLSGPRTEVEDLRVEALELVAEAGLRLGARDLPAAEAAARAAVAAAPFRESARALLIRVLEARGNVAEAVLAYEDLRTTLRDELGTAPGPELMALHERLISGAPPARPAAPAAPGAAGPGPAPPPAPPDDLVERDAELAVLDRLLARAGARDGAVVLLEGPAGIGKTRLLGELRRRGRAAGARVLEARAGTLERDNGYGVARQLFEPLVGEPDLFADQAAAARDVLVDVAAGPAGGDRSFAALHGLYRLTANLAERGPVVLCVDDLQWSDAPSLRLIAYLARRVGDHPVLVAATVRTGEPATDEALLAEISADPATTALRPRPLTGEATATLVRARLGAGADPVFAAACQEVTRGNPLLLRQLLSALEAEGVPPDAEHAAQVRAVGPRAVSRTVLLRLSRLPAEEVALARAVAILGEQPGLPAAAALAGLDEARAAQAAGALARAEILRPEEPLGFVHPLVRDAVYHELPAAQRAVEHGRAARLLADQGAPADQIATQLMATPPRGDAWVVERLREAARIAVARGAPEGAIAQLERAQAEPPPEAERPHVALELGYASEYVRGPEAVGHLRAAYEGLADPLLRAAAANRLARILLFTGGPEEGVRIAAEEARALPPDQEDLRQGLEAIELIGVFFGVVEPAQLMRLESVVEGPRGRGPGAKALTSVAALALAVGSRPSELAVGLAREALDGPTLFDYDPGLAVAGATQVLALADPAEGLRGWARVSENAARRGSGLDQVGADLWGGLTLLWAGDLPAAEASLLRAEEGEALWGTLMSAEMGYSAGFLCLVRIERGELAGARTALERTDASRGWSDGARFWAVGQVELLLAEERFEEALEAGRRLETISTKLMHPAWSPWRSQRARALTALGRRDEARPLLERELELAQRAGTDWIVGRELRILGEFEGEDGVPRLREALALLERSSARLELAKACAALGEALGGGEEAQGLLARAGELARECGAGALEARLAARAG